MYSDDTTQTGKVEMTKAVILAKLLSELQHDDAVRVLGVAEGLRMARTVEGERKS